MPRIRGKVANRSICAQSDGIHLCRPCCPHHSSNLLRLKGEGGQGFTVFFSGFLIWVLGGLKVFFFFFFFFEGIGVFVLMLTKGYKDRHEIDIYIYILVCISFGFRV